MELARMDVVGTIIEQVKCVFGAIESSIDALHEFIQSSTFTWTSTDILWKQCAANDTQILHKAHEKNMKHNVLIVSSYYSYNLVE
jgi:hypothetical protein